MELVTARPPEIIAGLASEGQDVWRSWTALEVIAKLTGVPILVMVQRHRLNVPDDPRITLAHHRFGDALCCMGERND